MNKQVYIRCPRCELNYILKKDKFCNVCKQEMKALGTLGAEENMDLELCPVCKVNYISPDEDMCPACAKERENGDGEGTSKFGDESDWSSYTNQDDEQTNYDDEETGDMVSITNLDDSSITDDDMDLELTDEDDQTDDDETFDGEFDDAFDNLDDEDEDDDMYDDEEDDIDDEDAKPSKKK